MTYIFNSVCVTYSIKLIKSRCKE